MVSNLALLAWRNIRTRKARSWLTITGVLVGVTAIVTLIAIGTGVERAVLQQFEEVGLDIVLLVPRESVLSALGTLAQDEPPANSGTDRQLGTTTLSQEGVLSSGGAAELAQYGTQRGLNSEQLQADVPEVTDIGSVATEVLSISTEGVSGSVRVMAVSWQLVQRFAGLLGGLQIAQGESFATPSDTGVLLGSRTAELTGAAVGDTITVEGEKLEVVGILEQSEENHIPVGASVTSGVAVDVIESLANTDDAVLILDEQSQRLWPGLAMSSVVAVRIRTGVSVTEAIGRINNAIAAQGVYMSPVSTQELADNVQRTLGMVKVVLASVAAISLFVGALGMMNTMYTSVLERRREIGILKSIGAKDRQVLGLFLIDSGLMGLTGGLLGLAVGVGASFVGTRFLGGWIGVTTFAPVFPSWLVLGSIALSFMLGAIAGVWPAWQAARLDPVCALAFD